MCENDKLIKDGLAQIAKGLFRVGQKDPRAAHDKAMAVVSTVRALGFDFIRNKKLDTAEIDPDG